MTMAVTEFGTMKKDLEQSYQIMKSHPVSFPQCKPSTMEKRVEMFERSPNLMGATSFVSQEQNHIQSYLPEQCINHFKPFEFPPSEMFGANADFSAPLDPIKGMIHINKEDQSKVVKFDFIQTWCTFDLSGLSLFIETGCRSVNDVQIVLNDAKIDVLALQEEMHERETAGVNGSFECYLLRHYSRTFHLPHQIAQKQATIRQENNVMCVYIPWK